MTAPVSITPNGEHTLTVVNTGSSKRDDKSGMTSLTLVFSIQYVLS